jgi:hypothetical protein
MSLIVPAIPADKAMLQVLVWAAITLAKAVWAVMAAVFRATPVPVVM